MATPIRAVRKRLRAINSKPRRKTKPAHAAIASYNLSFARHRIACSTAWVDNATMDPDAVTCQRNACQTLAKEWRVERDAGRPWFQTADGAGALESVANHAHGEKEEAPREG